MASSRVFGWAYKMILCASFLNFIKMRSYLKVLIVISSF